MSTAKVRESQTWRVDTQGVPFTPDEDDEAGNLIGWLWSAPASVRLVAGERVWVDLRTRTVRRKLKRAK